MDSPETTTKDIAKRIFASMHPERRKEISIQGGRRVAAEKRSFSWEKNLVRDPGGAADAGSTAQGRRPMSEDKARICGLDRKTINLEEGYEVRDWAFGVSEQTLGDAVARAGHRAEGVERELGAAQ